MHMKTGNLTTNLRVKTDFNLPEFSVPEIATWKYQVGDPAKSR